MIDVSDQSIEETATRVVRLAGPPGGGGGRDESQAPFRRGGCCSWWGILGVAIVVFYVLLTPVWLGIRALAWLADWRRAQAS